MFCIWYEDESLFWGTAFKKSTSPVNDIEKGVSLSASVIVIDTKLVSGIIELVKLEVWLVNDAVGKAFAATLTVILPEPILSYWSLNVISELIVSPDPVAEPLILTPILKLPLLLTVIEALEEVNEATAAELYKGE